MAEARQWMRLFDALGSPGAVPLLPHLSLRSADAPALHDLCPRAAASLRGILAETSGDDTLDQANGVLAAAYCDMEVRLGARLARSVFALASDGFPEAAELRIMERWDGPMRMLLRDFTCSGLPPSRRDVVIAMVGRHVTEMDSLRAATADTEDAAHVEWLRTLVEWRRFASLGRALARVLSAAERQRLAAFTRGTTTGGGGFEAQASTA